MQSNQLDAIQNITSAGVDLHNRSFAPARKGLAVNVFPSRARRVRARPCKYRSWHYSAGVLPRVMSIKAHPSLPSTIRSRKGETNRNEQRSASPWCEARQLQKPRKNLAPPGVGCRDSHRIFALQGFLKTIQRRRKAARTVRADLQNPNCACPCAEKTDLHDTAHSPHCCSSTP
jgi:hypothetical protein